MAADTQTPGPGTGTAAQAPDEEAGGLNWGRVLDIAGIAAGVLLAVIVADIWTDGRLISRRLLRKPEEGEPVDRDVS